PGLPENSAAVRTRELADQANVFEVPTEVKLATHNRIDGAANAFYRVRLQELASDPHQLAMPEGVHPQLFVGNIAISPGTVTRKGFIAEVTLRFVPVIDGIEDTSQYEVPAISAFPSGIGQNLHIESVAAYQRDIALQLRAMGYVAAAEALYEQSRLNTSDIKSANQRISISSFSRPSSLGFRIRGEYIAAELDKHKNDKDSNSAELLQDINVPFVVMAAAPDNMILAIQKEAKRAEEL